MNFGQALNTGKTFVVKNLPTILTGIGIVGVVGTAVCTGRGTLKAERLLRDAEIDSEAPLKEKLPIVWKSYIPAALLGTSTIACFIAANRISLKRIAALASVAATAERTLSENRESVKELFGDKGLRKVDEKLNEKGAEKYLANLSSTHIYETGHGSMLCCERYLTGILFRASPEWIQKCVNDYNAVLVENAKLAVPTGEAYNRFIELLIPGIDPNVLPDKGEELVYTLTGRENTGTMEIVCDSGLLTDTNEPYLIFTQRNHPILQSSWADVDFNY